MAAGDKDPGALKTIGELSRELGVAQHILRYWETRFPQLKPMQRAGNRRYYRPADVALARRIHRLLDRRRLYRPRRPEAASRQEASDGEARARAGAAAPSETGAVSPAPDVDVVRLIALRNRLAGAIDTVIELRGGSLHRRCAGAS